MNKSSTSKKPSPKSSTPNNQQKNEPIPWQQGYIQDTQENKALTDPLMAALAKPNLRNSIINQLDELISLTDMIIIKGDIEYIHNPPYKLTARLPVAYTHKNTDTTKIGQNQTTIQNGEDGNS